jgi:hypothetical protein
VSQEDDARAKRQMAEERKKEEEEEEEEIKIFKQLLSQTATACATEASL